MEIEVAVNPLLSYLRKDRTVDGSPQLALILFYFIELCNNAILVVVVNSELER